MRNLLTDVTGILVGNAHDDKLGSGSTAIVFERPAVAALDVRGGGPGTREASLLELGTTVEKIDAIMLSGGSAFGLDAAAGLQAWLAERGRGFVVGNAVVPIVPGAIVFDLLNGGDKAWGRFPPYRDLGYAAAANAEMEFALGTAGAGFGATTVDYKGGLGSASATTADGITVAAIVVVNAVGSVVVDGGPHFWAAPFEQGQEFGGRGWPSTFPPSALVPRGKGRERVSTTIALVATDAVLDKAQAQRLAVMAQTGMARAIYPVHTPLDGDLVFAVATGAKALPDPLFALSDLGALGANVLARAIARGVYEATALPFAGALPSWRDSHGG